MAERQKKPLSVNSFAVKIQIGSTTIDSFFTKCSAITKSYNSTSYSDGQSNIVYQLPGTVSYQDVTIAKPFTEDDDALIKAINAANTSQTDYVTVNIQPVYRDGYFSKAIGGAIDLKYCTVKSVTMPGEINTMGNDVAEVSITLSPGFVTSNGSKQFWVEPSAV